jgi:curved DNA-binding protein
MEYKDYYKILGLERSADADTLKRAYRKLARKYHPDVSKEPQAEDRFKEVQEAYEVLRDPEKRRAYDQLGSNWKAGQEFRPPPDWGREFHFRSGGGAGGGGDAGIFSDFFEQLFGGHGFEFAGGRGRAGATQGRRGEDIQQRVEISLEEAFAGTTRTLQLQGPEVDRTGRISNRTRTLNVRIPPGVADGQRIRLTGQGSPGMMGGKAGDIYLQVAVRPHPDYRLEGRDIVYEVPVAPWEAALGAKIEVPTPGGRISLSIPPGSQAGGRLRLKGRGLPGKSAGDLYVVLKIVNPPVDDPTAKALFQRMADELSFDPRAR